VAKISRVYLGIHAPPPDRDCDWCRKTAAHAFEIFRPRKKVGTAQFVYACHQHREVAERSADRRKAA
jgi:hypothetical protein